MFIDYIAYLENLKAECKSFKDSISHVFFNSGQLAKSINRHYCETETYQAYFTPVKQCVELLRLLKPRYFTQTKVNQITQCIAALDNSNTSNTLVRWNLAYDVIEVNLSQIEKEMRSIFSSLDSEERERINEAMHDCMEGCNYSCVVMSVSAVESRLYKLMTLAKPDSTGKINKMTLGQLINEYSENEGSYHNIVPDKHDALLALCNTYRIFSVHPKREHVSGSVATAILNLSITFLADLDSTPKSVKTQLSTK